MNAGIIREAKKLVTKTNKAFVTSDNSIYSMPRKDSIEGLLKHCNDNNLELIDVETGEQVKIKQSKKDVTTNG